MVVLYHQAKRIEIGFCMRKEVPSIKKCRLRSKKRHFHLDGSIKREKFRFKSALWEYQDAATNENFTKLVDKTNTLPVVSEFRNNRIHANVRSNGKSGGMFNSISRIDHYFTNNFFLGDIEGNFTDKIYNDNFFYQSDNRYFDYFLYY